MPRYQRQPIDFTPWAHDYRNARMVFGAGVCWTGLGLTWCVFSPTVAPFLFTMMAVGPLYYGFVHWEKGSKRVYGTLVEKHAVAKFLEILPERWIAQANLKIRYGNVDTAVVLRDRSQCVIDVKSWRTIFIKGGVLQRPGKNGRQEAQKAITQIFMQKTILHAKHGIIWLPRAKYRPTLEYKGIKIVHGGPKTLRALLQTMDTAWDQSQPSRREQRAAYFPPAKIAQRDRWTHFEVKFPTAPELAVRQALQQAGFYWFREDGCWKSNQRLGHELDVALMKKIILADGIITKGHALLALPTVPNEPAPAERPILAIPSADQQAVLIAQLPTQIRSIEELFVVMSEQLTH